MHFVTFTKLNRVLNYITINPGPLFLHVKELSPQMTHTKFQGNRPSGSREELFKFFFIIIYEHSGHLGHATWTRFTSLLCLMAAYEIKFKLAK